MSKISDKMLDPVKVMLNEALPLKYARKYFDISKTKYVRDSVTRELLDEVFKGKWRILLPVVITKDNVKLRDYPPFKTIQDFLQKHNFVCEPKDYIEGVCYKIRTKKNKEGEEITFIDYNNKIKIGKVLEKYDTTYIERISPAHKKAHEKEQDELSKINPKYKKVDAKPNIKVKALLDIYISDPLRKDTENIFRIVISRHPYDIAGMSTDRNWTSCMNLGMPRIVTKGSGLSENPGVNKKYIEEDIKAGAIIAYLVSQNEISDNDKIKLQKPISRILMKPWESIEDIGTVYDVGYPYGNNLNNWKNIIKSWVKQRLNVKYIDKGPFTNNTELYTDPNGSDKDFEYEVTDADGNNIQDDYEGITLEQYDENIRRLLQRHRQNGWDFVIDCTMPDAEGKTELGQFSLTLDASEIAINEQGTTLYDYILKYGNEKLSNALQKFKTTTNALTPSNQGNQSVFNDIWNDMDDITLSKKNDKWELFIEFTNIYDVEFFGEEVDDSTFDLYDSIVNFAQGYINVCIGYIAEDPVNVALFDNTYYSLNTFYKYFDDEKNSKKYFTFISYVQSEYGHMREYGKMIYNIGNDDKIDYAIKIVDMGDVMTEAKNKISNTLTKILNQEFASYLSENVSFIYMNNEIYLQGLTDEQDLTNAVKLLTEDKFDYNFRKMGYDAGFNWMGYDSLFYKYVGNLKDTLNKYFNDMYYMPNVDYTKLQVYISKDHHHGKYVTNIIQDSKDNNKLKINLLLKAELTYFDNPIAYEAFIDQKVTIEQFKQITGLDLEQEYYNLLKSTYRVEPDNTIYFNRGLDEPMFINIKTLFDYYNNGIGSDVNNPNFNFTMNGLPSIIKIFSPDEGQWTFANYLKTKLDDNWTTKIIQDCLINNQIQEVNSNKIILNPLLPVKVKESKFLKKLTV